MSLDDIRVNIVDNMTSETTPGKECPKLFVDTTECLETSDDYTTSPNVESNEQLEWKTGQALSLKKLRMVLTDIKSRLRVICSNDDVKQLNAIFGLQKIKTEKLSQSMCISASSSSWSSSTSRKVVGTMSSRAAIKQGQAISTTTKKTGTTALVCAANKVKKVIHVYNSLKSVVTAGSSRIQSNNATLFNRNTTSILTNTGALSEAAASKPVARVNISSSSNNNISGSRRNASTKQTPLTSIHNRTQKVTVDSSLTTTPQLKSATSNNITSGTSTSAQRNKMHPTVSVTSSSSVAGRLQLSNAKKSSVTSSSASITIPKTNKTEDNSSASKPAVRATATVGAASRRALVEAAQRERAITIARTNSNNAVSSTGLGVRSKTTTNPGQIKKDSMMSTGNALDVRSVTPVNRNIRSINTPSNMSNSKAIASTSRPKVVSATNGAPNIVRTTNGSGHLSDLGSASKPSVLELAMAAMAPPSGTLSVNKTLFSPVSKSAATSDRLASGSNDRPSTKANSHINSSHPISKSMANTGISSVSITSKTITGGTRVKNGITGNGTTSNTNASYSMEREKIVNPFGAIASDNFSVPSKDNTSILSKTFSNTSNRNSAERQPELVPGLLSRSLSSSTTSNSLMPPPTSYPKSSKILPQKTSSEKVVNPDPSSTGLVTSSDNGNNSGCGDSITEVDDLSPKRVAENPFGILLK